MAAHESAQAGRYSRVEALSAVPTSSVSLGEWLATHEAPEFEATFALEGATTVQAVVESGVTEDHLRELGMKLFVRAKLWRSIRELRSAGQRAGEITPLQAADRQLEAAKAEVRRAQETLAEAELAAQSARRLTVHIVGFGTFGQFLAQKFVAHGHTVVASSRGDYTELAEQLGVRYFRSAEEAIDTCNPQVVLLATSIMSTATVLKHLPVAMLSGRLVVDVLSVKEFPKTLLMKSLPPDVNILCTHPMFGPDSEKQNIAEGLKPWQNLNFQYEKVRLLPGERHAEVCELFIGIFRREGCRLIEMSCEEHDAHAAATQFITHTTGRMLAQLAPESTPINTKGYESLLRLVGTTTGDSLDLYCGLFYYNANSKHQLALLEQGLRDVRQQLEAFEAKRIQVE